MTEHERAAIIAYLQEQRRHLKAQMDATDRLIVALRSKKCYNDVEVTPTDTIAGVTKFDN